MILHSYYCSSIKGETSDRRKHTSSITCSDVTQIVNTEMEGQPLGNFEYVDCKMRDYVGLLALNRGEKNNALNAQLRQELVQGLKLLVAQGARCVRLQII